MKVYNVFTVRLCDSEVLFMVSSSVMLPAGSTTAVSVNVPGTLPTESLGVSVMLPPTGTTLGVESVSMTFSFIFICTTVPFGSGAAPMLPMRIETEIISPALVSDAEISKLSTMASGRVRSLMSSHVAPLLKPSAEAMTLTVRSPSSVELLRAANCAVALVCPAGMVTVAGIVTSAASVVMVTTRGWSFSVVLRETVSTAPVASPSRMVAFDVVRVSAGPSLSVMVTGTSTVVCLSPMAEQLQSVIYTLALMLTVRSPSTTALSLTPSVKFTVVVPAGSVNVLVL